MENADTRMKELELSDKKCKATIRKMLRRPFTNTLEISEKKSLDKEIENIKN